jgi:hypothetical protein
MSNLRPIMQAVVTVLVLALASYAMVSPTVPPDAQKWATGVIGTVFGFWLRGR